MGAMYPELDAITGGTTLRIPVLQSPNYSPGTAGWIIRGDGSVEFNNGTFRGSVQIGTAPGQHIVLANPSTGDALDVYDSGNNLVYWINNAGEAWSSNASGNSKTQVTQGRLAFFIGASSGTWEATGSALATDPTIAALSVVNGYGGASTNFQVVSGSPDASIPPTVQAQERGVFGSVMVSDQRSTNNLIHPVPTQNYTSDATGTVTVSHGCSFTPTMALANVAGLGDPVFMYFFSFSSTTAIARMFSSTNGANVTNATVPFTVVYFG